MPGRGPTGVELGQGISGQRMDHKGTSQDGQGRAGERPVPVRGGGEGGAGKPVRRRARAKPLCTICGCSPKRLYRIKVQVEGRWVSACAMCSGRLALEHPHYTYGGRFAPRRRRAS